jgi:hypothetical protein
VHSQSKNEISESTASGFGLGRVRAVEPEAAGQALGAAGAALNARVLEAGCRTRVGRRPAGEVPREFKEFIFSFST